MVCNLEILSTAHTPHPHHTTHLTPHTHTSHHTPHTHTQQYLEWHPVGRGQGMPSDQDSPSQPGIIGTKMSTVPPLGNPHSKLKQAIFANTADNLKKYC